MEPRVFICIGCSITVSKMVPACTSAMSAKTRSPSYLIIFTMVRLWGFCHSNGCIRVSYCGFGLTRSSWLITLGTFSYAYRTQSSCISPQPFGTSVLWKTVFPQTRVRVGGLGVIQGHCVIVHLFPLSLHQLHLRSSGIQSRRLGIPILQDLQIFLKGAYMFLAALSTIARTWKQPR